ncbi:MAG TPA: IscS subfamily cysteine desulfurase [Planctomycetes bacterium]|nr:IscS subfamily cysteine desulfurase [Planctomycetota bacterium]
MKPNKCKRPIYMDYNATTPCDPRVVQAMLPYFHEKFGNPASRSHAYGWVAEEAVSKARRQVADLIGASPKEIVFTSGATESDNLAIKGVAQMYAEKGKHVISCVTEHKAVLDSCKRLETWGYEVSFLPVDAKGRIDLEELKSTIRKDTILVSLMAANNETGTYHPIEAIGEITRERGVLFHCDATQAIGKREIDVDKAKIDLLSLSGHKIYGPKGIGALYVRRRNPRVRLVAQIDGGGHERGMRSGTLPVTQIVGLGEACALLQENMKEEVQRVQSLRDRLEKSILEQLDYVYINGDPDNRLPSMTNLSFAYVEGESLIMGMKDLAVSSGSACTSASLEPSYVLKAAGVEDELAHSSIRFSLGRFTKEEEIDVAVGQVVSAVKRLREMSPLYELVQEGVDLKSVKWEAH